MLQGQNNLQEQTESLFTWAISQVSQRPSLQALQNELQQCCDRLHQPMRVAIVGKIKAGKSTLMNALLGEAVVATGTVEATFNVNWLKYGERKYLRVHFKDDRPPEEKTFDELDIITRRADEHYSYLASIRYVEVFYPNSILQIFNLIDTPGLQSYYIDDSQNTFDFLQIHGKSLTETTQNEASNADAVLYLFSQSIATTDEEIMMELQGPIIGQATPINAIGVLTKVDVYWGDEEPMPAGIRIAKRLADDPHVRPLFYTIYPVCGLLALGAQTLQSSEFQILQQLAALPTERFTSLIRNVERFTQRNYDDISIAPTARTQVLERLGQYGVWFAYQCLQNGITNQAELVEALIQQSGIANLRTLIQSHFGHRAFLIKLSNGLQRLKVACFQQQQRLSGGDRQIVTEIAGRFEALESQAHAFQELRVLRSYYEGKLELSPEEVKQLLDVTGEHGTHCGQRLGLKEESTLVDMMKVAQTQMQAWQFRASDPFGASPQMLEAARVMTRSYERIIYHLKEAKKHLYI